MGTTGTSPKLRLNWLRLLLALIMIPALLFGLVEMARASVTLISFTATGMNGYILIDWETATELDNAGFYVQASNQANGSYSRISEFISSESDGSTNTTYSFRDNSITPGVVKWYRLESYSTSQTSEFTDPISAVSSTPVATTGTNDLAYPGPPPETSPYPGIPTTVSPYPELPTAVVPAATATRAPQLNPTATPTVPGLTETVAAPTLEFAIPETNLQGTLVPLPSITIQFVVSTPGKPATGVANSELLARGDSSGTTTDWSRYGTLGFILLIWALLGGWFWLSFRKLD